MLRAMVPVSVRADVERGALGNRVAAMWAPLPIGETDPVTRLRAISREMNGVKESGQAVGAAGPDRADRLRAADDHGPGGPAQAHQRLFNLVVTNVPGPQFPLYMLGRRLQEMFPMVPLAANQALGIAIMSYDGQLNFGLNADYDALPDVERLAAGSDRRDRRAAPGRRFRHPGMTRWLERVAIVLASLAIAIAIIALLSGGLAGSQDDPGVTGGQAGPGTAFRDLGDLHLRPGQPRPAYDSDPPTSGPTTRST